MFTISTMDNKIKNRLPSMDFSEYISEVKVVDMKHWMVLNRETLEIRNSHLGKYSVVVDFSIE